MEVAPPHKLLSLHSLLTYMLMPTYMSFKDIAHNRLREHYGVRARRMDGRAMPLKLSRLQY